MIEAPTRPLTRISTSIEVQASTQQALLAQGERLFTSWWTRLSVAALVLAPLVAVGIAIWK